MRRWVAVVALIAAIGRGEPAPAQTIVAGEAICESRAVRVFYEKRRDALAWFDGNRLNAEARDLIAAIEAVPSDGLKPSDYHIAAIRSLAADPASNPRDLDRLLTDAFLLLTSHLLAGRVDAESVEPTWCLEARSLNAVGLLEAGLENHAVGEILAQLAPRHAGYHRLREQLAVLRAIESRGGWPALARRPPRAQLVARLNLPETAANEELNAAIRHFQRLHGLAEDGRVGPKTLREMNVPVAQRIRQVELNMERWRWLPSNLGDRYAIINIPEFRLRVIDNGREMLSMKIVVGKYYQRTPIFSSTIEEIIFSPYWNVPQSIANKEIWPKVAVNPGYLAGEHMEVVSGGRIRQKPGPWNALGGIKFNIPNRFTVYLHDTPSRSLFGESVRAFSHGCIRIEAPVDLALYLLRDDPAWTRDQVIAYAERGVECRIDVKDPLPVHVLYWTAFVDDNDELYFAPDVYSRDARLDRAMREPVTRR